MSGAIPSLPLYALMAWTGTNVLSLGIQVQDIGNANTDRFLELGRAEK